jgi:hypothetical protein
VNRNYPVSVGGSVRRSSAEAAEKNASKNKKSRNGMRAAFLASAVLAVAGVVFYFGTPVRAGKASGPALSVSQSSGSKLSASTSSGLIPSARKSLPSTSFSIPMFFEPNQGQTAPQVKFLARGSGYGLFLTADDAVLQLQRAINTRHPSPNSQPPSTSVLRMHLEGANSSTRVSGASPLPGKSNYFIGNDPSKWHHDIPQFSQVKYDGVYPGVDLVYYGNQGQLEYDFRVAPGAESKQIALSFTGASPHIAPDSGDLILSTADGEVHFRAPHVYQPAAPQSGNAEKAVKGAFRQIADNKIGFTVGDYDHSRELVIDPVLSYSTYLGGSGTESLVNVAVDSSGFVYVVGSTNSTDFLTLNPPLNPPFQLTNTGQNLFIAVINPFAVQNQQLLFATYFGGSGTDDAAGIQVSTDIDSGLPTSSIDVYVAGSTTSIDFPVNGVLGGFQATPPLQPGVHGFVSRLNFGTTTTLRYSTYLSGTNLTDNATDTVTGVAIDNQGDAFVTGITTSTNDVSTGFPANPNAFQPVSNAPSQFFASKINTKGSGPQSMIYSTYFGGGNPQSGETQGGGIAVDTVGNMYITGGTNFLPTAGPNGEARFPLANAQQSCLDPANGLCPTGTPTALDAFVAKITPEPGSTLPVYATYLGGSGEDIGYGIAVDTSNNAYVTGSTTSNDWTLPLASFQSNSGGGQDAFIAKIGNLIGNSYPLSYFTYLGGSGTDVGQAIQVDSIQAAHVAGTTSSINFPITTNTYQGTYGGGESDAFVASISTTVGGQGVGDFSSYLGGTGQDVATGVAIDVFGATYAVGTTQSPFPVTSNAYQQHFNGGTTDAFVSKLGASSTLTVTPPTPVNTSPSPNPVAAGTQVAFTFEITNTGPDNASGVIFVATGIPTSGLSSPATAKVTSGGAGSCSTVQQTTIPCFIGTLAAGAVASVEVDMTPIITTTAQQIVISGNATANNSGQIAQCTPAQNPANIVNFSVSATTQNPVITAGDSVTFQVVFTPTSSFGYNATITPSQSTSPAMVTATTPTFNPTTVALDGTTSATTTLSIQTVARPTTTGSLLRRGAFYATWLPIGGLSLVGLGIGAGRKRRRWWVGAVLFMVAGSIVLQSACGSSSSSAVVSGGTSAGIYTITINGNAGTGASQSTSIRLQVN